MSVKSILIFLQSSYQKRLWSALINREHFQSSFGNLLHRIKKCKKKKHPLLYIHIYTVVLFLFTLLYGLKKIPNLLANTYLDDEIILSILCKIPKI